MSKNQSSNSILMVEPNHFELNLQAVVDNHFMNTPKDASNVHDLAVKEFTDYYNEITSKGVKIELFKPKDGIETPDCLFPNNWFSTHAGWEVESGRNTLVLYPMCHLNRRLERRSNIIEFLKNRVPDLDIVDLTDRENQGIYLEGTGSFVLDRIQRVAYICISQRSNQQLAEEWAKRLGYRLVYFTSVDSLGKIVYHTNVVMAICSGLAIVCLDSVSERRKELEESLSKYHTVLPITQDQVSKFCGNVIEVRGNDDKKYLVCSQSSYDAFTPEQKELILKHVSGFIVKHIPTIQSVGGGGIRCMIAELF
ncbi:hypothetical protein DLAC_09902 [Tieghemostelium lacteum]|uniref:Amidinotransferase n=1 Tax=Tieghemostelium lacteum TaxID=361077 RepID=A0A151Z5N4_TIELA|nr:hypothetical protein DLAC_09902 [Tieghemostelium lacteum]|eukprot:KYQ89247.1 hypothetical protein DLAC_09902 [Tieghemostelium lacteum]